MKDHQAKKLEEVMSNQEFVMQLLTLETPEDVQKAFEEKGVSFTLEEVKEMGAALSQELDNMNQGELSTESLETVSGGAVGVSMLKLTIQFLIRFYPALPFSPTIPRTRPRW